MRPQDLRIPLTWLIVALALMVLSACGGGGSSSPSGNATGGETAGAVPTMPPARFTAVAEQSVLTRTATLTATPALTETTTGTTTEEVAAVPAASAADLERGARSYERNKCADCHGAQGQGVAGKGQAIAGTSLGEQAFADILRTGGGLGKTHIFGPSAVSPTGMGALYAYVQSLK